MKIGVAINETWAFFKEVYAELAAHHTVRQFEPRQVRAPLFRDRLGRRLYRLDLEAFLRSQDVVFFEWASGLLAAATQLPKAAPIVTRLHRYELYQWADQVRWEAVDRIILVSQAKQREFAARFPAQAHKVVVIPEAISLARFQPQTRPFGGDVGILCNLTPRKRVYELILAFDELNRRQSGFRLHIGGGRHARFPEYADILRALVRKLGLDEQVRFYDQVSDPPAWYRNIDIFISNSYSEGLQVSPMEAIAAGCYCLSHWWDGADELLPEDNLYYTDAALIDKLLCYAAASPAEQQARQAALRQRICERFDMDRIKVQIREVVEAAAGR
jgi:glycosyltransferase involved in cell wall biosynthesis